MKLRGRQGKTRKTYSGPGMGEEVELAAVAEGLVVLVVGAEAVVVVGEWRLPAHPPAAIQPQAGRLECIAQEAGTASGQA